MGDAERSKEDLLREIAELRRELGRLESLPSSPPENEELFKVLAEQALVGVDLMDERGFIYQNEAGARIFGYRPEEILKKDPLDLVHPDDRARVSENIRDRLEGNALELGYTFRGRRRDGSTVMCEVHGRRITHRGRPAILGTCVDKTELKNAQAFIDNILETVDEGFIVLDNEFKITAANRAFCRGANRSLEEIIGRPCYEISHNLDKPCYQLGEECPVFYVFETAREHAVTHIHQNAEGSPSVIKVKAYPVRDGSGRLIGAIETFIDITEEKRLRDQLYHSQKMKAIGQLAGGIAHDFNNMLTAITGYAKMIQLDLESESHLKVYADSLLDSVDKAAALTHGLLAFSRKQILNPKPTMLNEIVSGTEKLLQRLIGEDIELRVALAPEEMIVKVDTGQIEQVLVNLATNARDAMPEGGALLIETARSEFDEEYLKSHGYGIAGSYAMISLSDTGSGLDEETRKSIFEPFFTTKDIGEGTGLGLSIVYGIIKQHLGFINVYSELGEGTTFKIYLPLAKEKPDEHRLSTPVRPSSGRETVLVAEDNPDVRQALKTVLEKFGYTVVEAIHGQDAVNRFLEHKDEIDLVILDVVMPKKKGKETYREIAAVRPDIKVLYISGYTENVIHTKGVLDKDLNFLPKPINPEVLLEKVRQLLDT